MFGLNRLFVLSTLALSALSSPTPAEHDDSIVDWGRLSALLDTINPAALHQVLHSLSPKFQDGVFSKDRSAIEHVHSENPIIATKLVYIAKRQSNATTTAATSSSPQQSSQAASISSVLSSQITASTIPASTSVLVAPSTPSGATAVKTVSNGVVYSTSGGGLVTLTSSAVGVHFTKSTSTHLYYTTLPDGTVLTSTSLIVVNAPVTETGDATGAAGAATSSKDAGLQNAAAKATMAGFGGIVAGAIGFLAAL